LRPRAERVKQGYQSSGGIGRHQRARPRPCEIVCVITDFATNGENRVFESRNDPNDAKASFDDIYTRQDPRDYYGVLGSLDYAIPDLANPIFRQLAGAYREARGRNATLLDLGSSYGINAALFRYPLSFGMLRRRYAQRAMLKLPASEVQTLDRNYFNAWPRTQPERIVVADVSGPAVAYAVRAGLADAGIDQSLEDGIPSLEIAKTLADIDIVVSTGCVGYVTEKTFKTILKAANNAPWVVSFVLRMFDYSPIEAALARAGLKTEKLRSAAFVQRRFRDEEEAAGVIDVLQKRGVDPTGLETDGLLYAELYVSRPAAEVAAAPLDEVVTIANGRNMSFGPRLVQVNRAGQSELTAVRS
jgi:hypothetical protein